MIAYVRGKLAELETDSVILDVGGIGYRVFTPVKDEILRCGIGNEVTLYTYFCVREDAQILYGFLKKEALSMFRLLLNVSGIGPKSAMAILTQMDEDALILAISRGDHKALNKVPGVGPKTAQRIVLELKDKVAAPAQKEAEGASTVLPDVSPKAGSTLEDAVAVMTMLGYTRSEAEKAIARVYAPDKDANTLVNEAFEKMN